MRARRQLIVVALLVTACRAPTSYDGVGDVMEIDASRQHLTIRHDGIPGLLEAGTVRVAVRSPELLADFRPGLRVRFAVQRQGDGLVVTRIAPVATGQPGVHDHTPHHGGVVAMVGMIHLEALATEDGRVRVYVSDVWRRPLPLVGVGGSVTLQLPQGKPTLPLASVGEALEAHGPPLKGSAVYAHVELMRDGQPIEMSFALPLTNDAPAAAGIPPNGCVSPAADTSANRSPRCVLAFSAPVTAIAATPDGALVLVAVVGLGVSAWRLPAGELAAGLRPPPPITAPLMEPVHPDSANALEVGGGGTDAVVAIEGRLLRYAIASGQLASVIAAPGMVRAVAWSPDGTSLLVTAFYDHSAHLLNAQNGSEIRSLPIGREGAAVAFTSDGRQAAVGTNTGPIVLFDVTTGARLGELVGVAGAVHALAFVGERLVSAGDDGVLRVWDTRTGTRLHEATPGRLLTRLAAAPGGRLVASAGLDGAVRLYDVDRGVVVETLQWHTAEVLGLAWAGRSLVSGDIEGQVAVWDLSDRVVEPSPGTGR